MTEVDPAVPLREMGLDSLLAMEILTDKDRFVRVIDEALAGRIALRPESSRGL